MLVDIAPAGEVIPGMQGRMITHSGPPITWEKMCGAQHGAMIGQVCSKGGPIILRKLKIARKGRDQPGAKSPPPDRRPDGWYNL